MKRIDLLEAIESIMIGVDKSTKSFGMDFIIFDNSWVKSYKDAISVAFPIETGIRGAVRAEEFYKILQKMSSPEVTLSIEENKILVKDAKTTLKMNSLQEEQLQQVLDRVASLNEEELNWYELPKSFIEGMGLCVFSAGTDPALNLLAGVHVEENKILSTDNYRVSVFEMESGIISPFTIPTKVADGFLKIKNKFEYIALTKAWVHLSGDNGAVFSARLMVGEYPAVKVQKVFENQKYDDKDPGFIFPDGLDKSLDRAAILAGSGENELEFLTQISFSFSKGKLQIMASREVGEIIDIIPWEKNHMPEGMELKMAPEFLKRILAISKTFKVSPTKKSVLFSSEKFRHIMIARIE